MKTHSPLPLLLLGRRDVAIRRGYKAGIKWPLGLELFIISLFLYSSSTHGPSSLPSSSKRKRKKSNSPTHSFPNTRFEHPFTMLSVTRISPMSSPKPRRFVPRILLCLALHAAHLALIARAVQPAPAGAGTIIIAAWLAMALIASVKVVLMVVGT